MAVPGAQGRTPSQTAIRSALTGRRGSPAQFSGRHYTGRGGTVKSAGGLLFPPSRAL